MAKNRTRRTNRKIFLDELARAAKEGQALIGNISLRESLGWDEEKYNRTKTQLAAEGAIILGRGRGGAIGLASAPGTRGLKLFVSYSHQDEPLKKALIEHLKPLQRMNLIETWHDQKIKPGDEWEKEVSAQIARADIILLLISIDFINSAYCYDVELEHALERHEAGNSRVIPIILRSCLWHKMPFAKLQALPKEGKAITSWRDQDEALLTVVEGIQAVAEEILET
jgi:hypothetical protein